MSSLEEKNGTLVMPCGCTTEYVNGKYINYLCDEHEEEYQEMVSTPVYYKKTKMRETREI